MRIPAALVLLALVSPVDASVTGVSRPAPSLTQSRIDALADASLRRQWTLYLERSQQQRQIDRAALAAERGGLGAVPPPPKESGSAHSIPLGREAAFYATPQGLHIADVILSFQTPAGGWSKNLDMSGAPRLRGQSYTTNNLSRYLGANDFDAPADPGWNYVGTLDNDATTTQLRFLVRVAGANPGPAGNAARAGFLAGLDYLLAAQFPNGGWPQVWPLEGGYHDAITFNDNAVTEAAAVMTDAANGAGDYAFVPAGMRAQARASAARALQCILATQVVLHGKRTVWAQQHDALTLAPVSGRNFEPAALASGESADILLYLMSLPNPSDAVGNAIVSAAAWLKSAAIYGQDWSGGRNTEGGRQLAPKPGAGPIWARYSSLTTGKPIFGDRDKTIHDQVNELSLERRNGYAWYSDGPQRALDAYAKWSAAQAHGRSASGDPPAPAARTAAAFSRGSKSTQYPAQGSGSA